MKRGRKPKYKTAAERSEASRKIHKKWVKKNREKICEYQRKWYKANYVKKGSKPASADVAALNERMEALEARVNDIIADCDELSQDSRKFKDFMNWRKK